MSVDDDTDVDSPQERYERLAALFESWDWFREACDPVSQADALLRFANEFTHFRWQIDAERERIFHTGLEAPRQSSAPPPDETPPAPPSPMQSPP